MRGSSIVLGVGLLVLWIIGLVEGATRWLTWLDFVAGLLALGISLSPFERASRGARAAPPTLLAVGLFVLWIVGLLTAASHWLVWLTFIAACAFLVLALTGGSTMERSAGPRPV